MDYKILVCGGNGSGKSTIGKELAKRLSCKFMDIEDYYFNKGNIETDIKNDNESNRDYKYKKSKTKEEVINNLLEDMRNNNSFVMSAVTADYGSKVKSYFNLIIMLEVDTKTRMKRVYDRSYKMFGDRVKQEGDLFESEKLFFKKAEEKDNEYVRKWANTLNCDKLFLDGTKEISENIDIILNNLKEKEN